ncbi:ABC transporter permease [Tersicoccus phoenicis]|uniref:ABC transporter permease n=1 Tax=Tersicoccus phoenicis TaxID=554083 RepID=UPI001F3A4ABD|nr:ABC transporter permease [Tersicoccus phoenicis]
MLAATLQSWAPTILAVAVLSVLAGVGLAALRVPGPRQVVTAILRAAVQLMLLSAILGGVITDLRLVAIALVVMLGAAAYTAARRAHAPGRMIPVLAVAVAAGPAAVMTVVFSTGAIEFSARYLLAIGGIVIGNAMTTAALTSRLLDASIIDHWDEVEAWLSLGATPRQAVAPLARSSVHTALIPTIDQTRTTGIVVLPGAFVGAVFAGASPLEAGRFQLVVLACILTSGVITASTIAFRTSVAFSRPTDHRAIG